MLVFPTMQKIVAQANNRAFVGLPLCAPAQAYLIATFFLRLLTLGGVCTQVATKSTSSRRSRSRSVS